MTIENHVRCVALVEMVHGEFTGIENGFACILGTGVGGALVLNMVVQGYEDFFDSMHLPVKVNYAGISRYGFIYVDKDNSGVH